MRAAAGVGLVQRQAGLPVPPRLHQRHPSRPGSAENLYVREDQILPWLAALAILQMESGNPARSRKQASSQVTAPAQAAELIDRLRATGTTLTYDPATRALRTDAEDALAVTVG